MKRTSFGRGLERLEGLTTEQRAGVLALAYRKANSRTPLQTMKLIGLAVLLTLISFIVLTVLFALFVAMLGDMPVAAGVILLVSYGAVPALVLWTLHRRRVRRLIANGLGATSCPMCDYSLAGAPIEGGQVLCPECAHVCILRALGVTERDLEQA